MSLPFATETDFDLHGLVGIRLMDAGPSDVATVRKQLGFPATQLDGRPDIVIRFVDRLRMSSGLRYIGLHDSAFTEDQFLVLRSRHKRPARVQIPLDRIGQHPELVCERGVSAVPLLVAIVNLTMLSKDVLPLHAAAFRHRGIGTLVTGWSKGGKTEALLAFMSRGAQYVGDEWVYLLADGSRMFGIPEPIRVWGWHLEYLPEYRHRVAPRDLARLRAIRLLLGAGCRVRPDSTLTSRASHLLERQLYVDIEPHRLFDDCVPRSAAIDRVFLVGSHADDEIIASSIDPREISARMTHSLQYELAGLREFYLKYRFAFPDASNPLIDGAEGTQRRLLDSALVGKPCYSLQHPYPVALDRLFDAMDDLA
jgi:hypothetical protein